jgi:RNAse (barnase) inhibitor barstar
MKELIQLRQPYFHIMIADRNQCNNFFSHIEREFDEDVVLKLIDGIKCTTVDDLFYEFSKAFEFPDYFGNNWAAFDECLNDLDWLEGKAYVLFISDSDKIIITSENDFKTLMKLLVQTIDEWTEGKNYDEFPKSPIPFHVVLQCSKDGIEEFEKRLKKAGVMSIEILDTNI